MAKIFTKNKHNKEIRPQTKTNDLVDPLLYQGDLDLKKYPPLPLAKEEKFEEEIENPLNKR